MATWSDVKRFVGSRYTVEELSDTLLKLVFDVGNLRSQVVFVEYAGNDSGASWMKALSPIGSVDEIDLRRASEVLSTMIFGGLISSDGWVYVTNGIPLGDLDPNEVTEPLERIAGIADGLER